MEDFPPLSAFRRRPAARNVRPVRMANHSSSPSSVVSRSGRFTGGPAAEVATFSESVSFDWRLWRHDLRGSVAHATMLRKIGVLTATELKAITAGFADPNQTKVGAGTLTISQGGGELKAQTNLSALNGGKGVQRGVFRRHEFSLVVAESRLRQKYFRLDSSAHRRRSGRASDDARILPQLACC